MRNITRHRAFGGGAAALGLILGVALMVTLFVTSAEVSSAQTDGDHDKISVTKVAYSLNQIKEGDTATFTITVTTQPFPISDVVLTETLPPGGPWTLGGDAASGGCAGTFAGGAIVTCSFGTLGDFGVVATRTITVSGPTSDSNCGVTTNSVRVVVSSSEGETRLLNNAATASVNVNCGKRMTGGGSIFPTGPNGIRVTHGFELHCNRNDVPNRLEINWDGGNNFHLENLTSVTCSDDPAIAPPPPAANFDTYIGAGTGRCNGLPASITFRLTDASEPGTADTAQYTITGGCSLNTPAPGLPLTFGNHQAH